MTTPIIQIDSKSYATKPIEEATQQIVTRIKAVTSRKEVTPEELAHIVSEGRTVTLAHFEKGIDSKTFISQSYVMIDFDNEIDKEKTTGDLYQSYEDALQDKFFQQNALFMYKSYSHTEEHNKFHVVFRTETPMTNAHEVRNLYEKLLVCYPLADQKIKNVNRIFFGGCYGYDVFNFNNKLDVVGLDKILDTMDVPKRNIMGSYVVEQKKDKNFTYSDLSISSDATNVVTFFTEKNIEGLIEYYAGRYAKTYDSNSLAFDAIKQIPMGELLDLPENEAFLDIFHDEDTPSANIYKYKDGFYYYKCFSSSSEFFGDIHEITMRLTGLDFFKAMKFLMEILEIKVELSDEVKAVKLQIDILISLLRDPDKLKRSHTPIWNAMSRDRGHIINVLVFLSEKVMYDAGTRQVRFATALSQREIAKAVGLSSTTANRVLNKMKNMGIIRSLPAKEIPQHTLDELCLYRKTKGFSYRMDVLEIEKKEDPITELSHVCTEYNSYGFVAQTGKRKALLMNEGKEKADKIFVQDTNRDSSITDDDVKSASKALEITRKLLSKNGYVHEKAIYNQMRISLKRKAWSLDELKAYRPTIVKECNLQRIRVTKATKEKYNITDVGYNGFVLVPVEGNE